MAKRLSRKDRVNLWRSLQTSVSGPESTARFPDASSAPQGVDAVKLQSTVDARFGIGSMLLAIVVLIVLILLPPHPWKWAFYVADVIIVLQAAWFIDRGNRRLRRLIRHGPPPPA
jgi:hypothetical protein